MRWQGCRESDNVENRRDHSSAYGRRTPDPYSAWKRRHHPVMLVVAAGAGYYGYDLTGLLTGGDVAPTSQQQQRAAPTTMKRRNSPASFSPLLRYLEQAVPANRQRVRCADAGDVRGHDPDKLRHRLDGDGAVLLSGGSACLYRPFVL